MSLSLMPKELDAEDGVDVPELDAPELDAERKPGSKRAQLS